MTRARRGRRRAQRQAAAGGSSSVSDAEVQAIRAEAVALVRETTGDAAYNDVNYVFPTFITDAACRSGWSAC